MYSFITHWHFVSLRNSFFVSNNTMKTLTTQKSIIWSQWKYVWATILKVLFISNKKGKHCLCLTTKWSIDLLPTYQRQQSTFIYQVFSSVIVKKVTNRHNRTLLVCYTASMHFSFVLHGILRNQYKVSQAYETSVSKKWLYTKQTTLQFVVRNEQCFPSLKRRNNTFRIFMVLLETKSALVIKNFQLYCLSTVWNSDVFGVCFFGWLDFFFKWHN